MRKRFFSLLGVMIMAAGAFTGCKSNGSDSSSGAGGKIEQEEAVEVVSPSDGYDYTNALGNIADYKVIVSENATGAEQYAANTLISYVKEVTGKTIAYGSEYDSLTGMKGIVIGATRHWDSMGFSYTEDDLNGDGFILKTVGDDVFVRGAIDRGTIYGVMDLVEYMLDVKFLAEDYTYIPSNAEAKVYSLG